MAIKTVEIKKVDQATGKLTYAGYGKFDGDKYLGSFGGYGSREGGANGSRGRGTSDYGRSPFNGGLRMQGNAANRGSALGNAIRTSGSRQSSRTRAAFRLLR